MMRELGVVAERTETATQAATFLAGGGAMGALMRVHNWARTPLGPIEQWPESWRTAVSICLNSRFPMVLWLGPELVLAYNDAWRPVLGANKHPQALGSPGRLIWPEIWDIIGHQLGSVMERGEATWSDDLLLVLERNNYTEEAYFTYSYSPIKERDGTVSGVFSAVSETTDRVLSERRLALLRELAARTADSKSVKTACEAFASVLRGHPDVPFAQLYLVEEQEAALQRIAAVHRTGDPAVGPDKVPLKNVGIDLFRLSEVMLHGRPLLIEDIEERIGCIRGDHWPEQVRAALVLPVRKAGQAAPTGVLVAGINPRRALDDRYRGFFDLIVEHLATALANARAYEAERRRAEALAELDRAKTAFFSNISHEFRTPLTLMLGNLEEALRAQDLSEARRAELMIAHRNSLRLLRLVNTLLDFSRVEAGRIEASYEPVDLAALTAELASNFRSACDRAGLRFEVDCAPLPEPLYVDREMWEKIVLNLVSNAFKFTLEGGIAVRLAARGGQALLTVSDTGTGIPKEEQSRVFQRFHRVAGALGRTHEGTGIGLALVQELVWLHGGKVAVDSEPGVGSTFTVSIPLGSAHLPADRIGGARRLVSTSLRAQAFVDEALRWLPGGEDARELVVGHDAAAGAALGRPLARRRVLIVDDNADMREYIARLLRPLHDVELARDGLEALAAIAERRPDLVLSDVMMPSLDGIGLLRAIRADPSLADIPAILLSARAGEEAQVEGLDAGADDYLVKPFAARELLARVNANLQMAETRRKALEEVRSRERELRDRAALLDAIMATVPAAIWVAHDPEASRITGSRYAAELLRLSPDANHSKSAPPETRPSNFRAMKGGREVPPEALPVQRACRGEVVRLEELDLVFDDGSVIHELVNAAPVRDETGRVTGAVGAAIDITARRRAEQALAASEAQLRAMFENAGVGMVIMDGNCNIIRANAAFCSIAGRTLEELIGTSCLTFTHPDDIAMNKEVVARLESGVGPVAFEKRYIGKNGNENWVRITLSRIDAQQVLAVVESVTERVEAQQALVESEARFRNMADYAPVMVWVTDASGACTYLGRSWYEFTGQRVEDGLGFGWIDCVHPDDRASARHAFVDANARHVPFRLEYRLRRHDGDYRWAIDAAVPRFGEAGEFLGYIGSVIDITERKQAEEQRELLINELNHRVKNTLASVQSIAMQTMRNTATSPDFQDAFVSRLVALSRAHDLLTRSSWQSAELDDIVRQTLEPYGLESGRLCISGPSMRLKPSAAVTLSMALHELTTNASKYGALSNSHGRISVEWSLDGLQANRVLAIAWSERDGPRVAPPQRRGFGSRLIERGIAQELDGGVALEFDEAGVRCRIRLPLSERIAVS
ncbi:MAG TPA: PAS domain S-box protein [Alphaproteobacteria bacterium]|nr:PAS domain S-box protein [Alphaproteobacteria bacterium]